MPGREPVVSRARSSRGHDPLSPAEATIVAEVLAGRSNAEIARRLGKGVGTVKNQLSAAYRKLGVRSRAQLIVQHLAAAGFPTSGTGASTRSR